MEQLIISVAYLTIVCVVTVIYDRHRNQKQYHDKIH